MTLIAFHATAERAVVMTDTWAYAPNVRTIGRSGSKAVALPALEAVVACQGDGLFSQSWKATALMLADEYLTFDDFADAAPQHLRRAWFKRREQWRDEAAMGRSDGTAYPSAVFLIGWSPREERFRGVSYSSLNGFEPTNEDGLFVYPSPFAYRPSVLELRNLSASIAETGERPGDMDNVDFLLNQPEGVPPTNGPEWIDLGVQARMDRARAPLGSRLKVLVGGELHLTILHRGQIIHERAHVFEDDAQLEREIFAGTMHPIGQFAPCACGSGDTYLDCCIAKAADDPCTCHSGRLMGQCCSLNADTTPATTREARP